MRKTIVTLIVLMCIGTVQADDLDITVWAGMETGNSSAAAAMSARLGIESKESNLEGFIGVTGWPQWDAIEGKLRSEPPVVLEVGGLYHFDDIIDVNNPMPILPDILTTYLNPELDARPYVGIKSTVFNKGTSYSPLVGLEMSETENSPLSFNAEAQFPSVDNELAQAGITDEVVIMLFLKYRF